jgi:hypothetical protein
VNVGGASNSSRLRFHSPLFRLTKTPDPFLLGGVVEPHAKRQFTTEAAKPKHPTLDLLNTLRGIFRRLDGAPRERLPLCRA